MSVSILVVIYSIFGWMCLSENRLKHEHACAPAHTQTNIIFEQSFRTQSRKMMKKHSKLKKCKY